MYPNLRAELARRNLTLDDVRVCLGKESVSAVSSKMRGVSPFTFDEAIKIKNDLLKTDIPLEILFERAG